jgi:hypothetical protein
MSKIQVNEVVNHFDNGAPDFPRGVNVIGISSLGITTVTGVGQTALTVNGDARVTGVLTVGQGSITIDGTSGSSSITGVTTAGITSAYLDSVNDLNYPTAGPLSNRNLIHNGAMNIAQRGTSFNSDGYCLDRFKLSTGPAGFTVTQSPTAPEGFSNSIKFDCTSAATPSGNQEIWLQQVIEAQNLQHLDYGSSTAKSLTISFWVRSNKTGDFGLWFYQDDAEKQYATTYTINSANTWEYKTITIPGDTTGGFTNDTGAGLYVRFYLGADNYAGTPGEAWTSVIGSNRTTSMNLADNTDNEWYITGLQLEVGTKATPFEHRSYGEDLQICYRYCQQIGPGRIAFGQWSSGTTALVTRPLFVHMRTSPSIYSYTAGNCLVETVAWYSATTVVIQTESRNHTVVLNITGISNSGQSVNTNCTWGNGAQIVLQADL